MALFMKCSIINMCRRVCHRTAASL